MPLKSVWSTILPLNFITSVRTEIDVRQQVRILDTSKFLWKWASGLRTGKSRL
jgi:hypothetical protein